MAAISPGVCLGPPRKRRKQTQRENAHRYESFSKRIAKLKIDPIHKTQQSRLQETNDSIFQSHFRTALDEFSETNLTKTFTSFLNRVLPLSESLPQLLHHADQIASILLEYIEKEDSLALEPLLSLTAHLAHDLGQEFEKYFIQIVKVIVKVSTTQDDPAVIEACFTCLAWIFKFLSRLLVLDLRPLLDTILPYFSARKEHIRRFAAESLAFLVRKAAILRPKNPEPLQTAIEHIFKFVQSVSKDDDKSRFNVSIATLVAESATGTDAGLHSSATELYRSLDQFISASFPKDAVAQSVLEASTVSLVHRCDSPGFRPLLELIIDFVNDSERSSKQLELGLKLLFIAVCTRGGSRIHDWKIVLQTVSRHLERRLSDSQRESFLYELVVKTLAASVHYATLDHLLPFLSTMFQNLTKLVSPAEIFTFCEMVARLNKTKFQDLVLPDLQRYIVSHWSSNEPGIVVLLNDLHKLEGIQNRPGKPGYTSVPSLWDEAMREAIRHSPSVDTMKADVHCLLLARSVHFPKGNEKTNQVRRALARGFDFALSDISLQRSIENRVRLGWGFQTLVWLSEDVTELSRTLCTKAMSMQKEIFQLVPFLEAFANVILKDPKSFSDATFQEFMYTRLQENLLNASTDVRKASVSLLHALAQLVTSKWLEEACDLFQEILDTQYSISNARKLAMLVRKLPYLHRNVPTESNLFKLVPGFTLGLLLEYHDQLRKDVAAGLAQMMTIASTEQQTFDVLRDWLYSPVEQFTADVLSGTTTLGSVSPDESIQLNVIEDAFENSARQFANPEEVIGSWVEAAHTLWAVRIPRESRLIALQVLIEMPSIAERKSKIIVPAFLASQRGRRFPPLGNNDESHSVNTLSPDIEDSGWSSKERKLFLQLLGCFHNPRTLYRADDVYNVLLNLLSNGDPETRKLALLALSKWKHPALDALLEDLLKIAEDKNTTVELGVMLVLDDDFNAVEAEHRSEVLPMLLRLIFGQLVGRVGVHGSQEAKRKTILRLLFRMNQKSVDMFLDIVLGPFEGLNRSSVHNISDHYVNGNILSLDQQYGFLRMILSILEVVQSQFQPYGEKVMDAVLYCTAHASQQINQLKTTEAVPAMLRNVRRIGLQCLNLVFKYCKDTDVSPFIDIIYRDLISPRLSNFVTENLQSVSGLLQMFSVLARSAGRITFLHHNDDRVLGALWAIVSSEKAKPIVKSFVLEEVVLPILQLSNSGDSNTGDPANEFLKEEAPAILDSISNLLKQAPSKDLLLITVNVVQELSDHVESEALKERVMDLMTEILHEPHQRLPPHIKSHLLKAIERIAKDVPVGKYYRGLFFEDLSNLLNFFHDVPNRQTCGRILECIARDISDLSDSSIVCQSLNAKSGSSLEEVDHERRSSAFAKIHEMLSKAQQIRPLLPIVQNLIYLVRCSDETATRGNALSCLKHFVAVASGIDVETSFLKKILLDAVRKHVKDDSEVVRADFVEILGAAVKHWKEDNQLNEMQALLVGNDEEAAFFTNILHIQHHRRTRAIRRLIIVIEAGVVSASTIAEFFLPLLQKFANDGSTSDSAQATKGQAIASMTTLLQWLDWKSFRKIFRQYRQTLDNKSEDSGIDVRLLNHSADALTAAINMRNLDAQHDAPLPHLTKSLPVQEVIEQELKTNFIPKLAELSHYKDEGEISQRVPAAVVAIKLIKLLPENEISFLAAPIVLDVAQLLRSREQQNRNTARNKLAEMVALLGASSLQFVLRQMRTVLTRGYQLHVLAYTLHTILLATIDQREPGDLDYCLEDIVKVLLEDVLGTVGQEKEDQNYISSMKEVKSNKSFDSMEILAKSTSAKHLSKLVLPFESLLSGSLAPKQMRKIDELLRRIGVGVSQSSIAGSQHLLVFAFELIQSFYKVKSAKPLVPLTNEEKNRSRFLVQPDNVAQVDTLRNTSLLYKIAKFAIDLVRSTLLRHTELMTPESLYGFLPVVGDLLIEGQEDVKVSAMRLLSVIIKLKIPSLEENARLYIIEAVKVVKSTVSTDDEAAQAALKMVAAIIRDKPGVEARESDMAYLLKRLMPDLDDPDRQGVTFTFVKAIMARQMQMPEVYELADKLGHMMVVSQSRNSRDAARGVYVHFLLDYPQAQSRWSKQVKFLVKNLEYQYPEGRQSIMEALNTLISKLDGNTGQELGAVIFVPVVLHMASDEDVKCQTMAAALLSQLFEKTSVERRSTMLETLHNWLEQDDNQMLVKLALQAFSICLTTLKGAAGVDVALIQDYVLSILRISSKEDHMFEVQYQAIELMAVMVTFYPEQTLSKQQGELWTQIIEMIGVSDSRCQSSASKLVGLFFHQCVNKKSPTLPLACSYGFAMSADMLVKLLRSSLRLLRHQGTSSELAEAVLQNTYFLGHCLDSTNTLIPLKSRIENTDEITSDEDDGSSEDEAQKDIAGVDSNGTGDAITSISTAQYMLDQATRAIRREPSKQNSAALRPKISFLELVEHLVPLLSQSTLSKCRQSIVELLVPMIHLTSTTTSVPRSSDISFATTYQNLIERTQACLNSIETALGDQEHMKFVTAATKLAREKRSERRNKRAFDTVADPERAAKEKRRKFEKKKERRKEVKGIHRGQRRKDLGF